MVENNPTISIRRIGHALHVPHHTVWRRLKKFSLYPYHIQQVQRLKPRDFQPRINFSRWIVTNRRLISRCLFTDEAQFTRDGVFNLKNSHIWADENPSAKRQTNSQHRFSFNVWCGVLDNHLIGPYVLPQTLTGEDYSDFLQDTVPILLEDEDVGGMYFQHEHSISE